MASVELHQSNCYSGDEFPRSIPRKSHPHALQNTAAPPSANDGQLEGYVHHSVRGTDVPDGPQGPHNINEVDHGIVDHHPLSLDVPAVPYLFPDVRFGQGILAQVQPDAPPEDQHALFHHAQHILPGPAQAAFPDPFARQPPTPGKSPEHLRRLAVHYLHNPGSQVDMVRMEPGAAGRIKVVAQLTMAGVVDATIPGHQPWVGRDHRMWAVANDQPAEYCSVCGCLLRPIF